MTEKNALSEERYYIGSVLFFGHRSSVSQRTDTCSNNPRIWFWNQTRSPLTAGLGLRQGANGTDTPNAQRGANNSNYGIKFYCYVWDINIQFCEQRNIIFHSGCSYFTLLFSCVLQKVRNPEMISGMGRERGATFDSIRDSWSSQPWSITCYRSIISAKPVSSWP